MEMLLASNNTHKAVEFRRLFPGHTVRLPSEVGVDFSFEETAESYLGNALGKATALYQRVHEPVLADDSGLAVTALEGEPGILSSRYGSKPGGPPLGPGERNRLLLDRLRGEEMREAFFVCCMVLVLDHQRFYAVQETLRGEIAQEPRGSAGFGYDPIFTVPERGRTVAEMTDAEKDGISHRGRAARCILSLLAGCP